ncbi:unnamed protein product [Leptidea sinapis]|uniref:MADF domain-containing protein n=1 Tax=Leptidea sinapis TaxID=189913 RepID=A0A5E4R4Z2_9NEOP|nr:unnamed protein product [Leptidea sinapis]
MQQSARSHYWQLDKQSNNILLLKQLCSKELRVSLVRLKDVNYQRDAQECLKMWTNIRNNYRKAMKNRISKSGDSAKPQRPIKHERELQFLNTFLQNRTQQS